MATLFVAVEIAVEYLLALLAHRIRALLERAGKGFNRACGGMFVAMGVALPMTRSARLRSRSDRRRRCSSRRR